MSGKPESSDVTIPPGRALIFTAPEGGREWRLHNTAQGLMIEEAQPASISPMRGRPILTLTPEGVIVRGDLIVDGQVRREFDCRKFAGEWEVIEGSIPGDPPKEAKEKRFAIIRHLADGSFILSYRREEDQQPASYQYFLRFNPRTGTLDSEPGKNDGHPGRCISFWDGRARGGDGKHRIFAMRRRKDHGAEPFNPDHYLPWELNEAGDAVRDDDNGTWGAEEGGL